MLPSDERAKGILISLALVLSRDTEMPARDG